MSNKKTTSEVFHERARIENIVDRRSFLNRAAAIAGAGLLLPAWTKRSWAGTDDVMTPTVTTQNGKLRGRILDGIHTFKGIPYGAPTGGANRFQPPQPAESWTGVRDAFEYAHYAPQSNRPRGAKQLEFFGILAPQAEHFPMSKATGALAYLEAGQTRYRIVPDADFPS